MSRKTAGTEISGEDSKELALLRRHQDALATAGTPFVCPCCGSKSFGYVGKGREILDAGIVLRMLYVVCHQCLTVTQVAEKGLERRYE